ncbi:MAG: DUF4440 domain-containing protein [Steroidobacteraceae bacterium]
MLHTRRDALCLLSTAVLAMPSVAASRAVPPPGAGPARDRLAVQRAARDWIDAFKRGDLDALMALYEPDAYVALHGQPALRGIEAVRNYFAPRVGRGQVEFLLDIERIDVRGSIAHLVSGYWFTLDLPGQPRYEDAGRSLLIYRRGARGQWRIHLDIDQDTPDITFPPPPSAR